MFILTEDGKVCEGMELTKDEVEFCKGLKENWNLQPYSPYLTSGQIDTCLNLILKTHTLIKREEKKNDTANETSEIINTKEPSESQN